MTNKDAAGTVRYRRVANLREAPDGAILSPRATGQRFFPTPAQRKFLQACSIFVTPEQLWALGDASASDLATLESVGLLETEQGIIRNCMARATGQNLSPIKDLGILTCASPALLQRSVTSWAKIAAAHTRRLRFIVVDDSPTSECVAEQRAAAGQLESGLGTPIRFVDPVTRTDIAGEIARSAGVDAGTVEFGLSGRVTPRVGIGGNRNLMTLLTRGRRFVSADDDVVAEFATPGERRESAWITSAEVPLEAWFYDSMEDTAAGVDLGIALDPFALHESVVGRALADVLVDCDGRASLQGSDPSLTAAVSSGTARVAATAFGLAGDCASDCAAFFSLLATGATRDRLLARADPLADSREVLRRVPSTVLCQGVGLMTFCHAIDNIDFVPPYFPVGRGEDQLWQKMLHWCDPSTVVGHLPVAVAHRPGKQRRYSRDDYVDPCREFPANAFLLGAVDSCPVPYVGFDAWERLEWLADYLGDVAARRDDFRSLVEQTWRAYLSHHQNMVRAALQHQSHYPPWWRDAMSTAMKRMAKHLKHRGPVPLEYAALPPAEAVEALRLDVTRFAAVLRAWPGILTAAADTSARIATDDDWLRP